MHLSERESIEILKMGRGWVNPEMPIQSRPAEREPINPGWHLRRSQTAEEGGELRGRAGELQHKDRRNHGLLLVSLSNSLPGGLQ